MCDIKRRKKKQDGVNIFSVFFFFVISEKQKKILSKNYFDGWSSERDGRDEYFIRDGCRYLK